MLLSELVQLLKIPPKQGDASFLSLDAKFIGEAANKPEADRIVQQLHSAANQDATRDTVKFYYERGDFPRLKFRAAQGAPPARANPSGRRRASPARSSRSRSRSI